MTITRWTDQDLMATQLLTEKFGVEFWKKAVLVLTKGNMLKPRSPGIDDKTFCKRAYDNFLRIFQAQLIKQEVPKEIATSIPTVAAGSYTDKYLPYVSKAASDDSEQNYQDFLPELWLTCFERISHNPRYTFISVENYSKRIEVNKDYLPQEQKEFIEEYEQQCEEKDKEQPEICKRRYNEKRAQLQFKKERELENLVQEFQKKRESWNFSTKIHRSDSYLKWYTFEP